MKQKVCVIGGGKWGRNHIRTLHSLGCLAGIADTDEEILKSYSKDYPKARLFQDYKDAAADNFDGYTIATPAETHYDIALYLLERKKHILVEKPVALTAQEARHLKNIADKNHVNLMVGHVLLFHPAIRKIKELIKNDKIGKLQYLYSNRLNLGTVRTEENILWSFAPHDVSLFQYFIETLPTEIISRGGAFLQPTIHDSTLTILKYPENIVGHIFVSWLHPFKEQRLVVIGSKGMISFEDSSQDKQILFYEKGIDWIRGEPIKRDGPTEIIDYNSSMPLTEELKYFVKHLNGESIDIADSQNAIDVLEILERATDSMLKGAEEIIDEKRPDEKSKTYYVHPSAVIDENVRIGKGTKIYHFSHIQSGARIGENCTLGKMSMLLIMKR